MICEFPLTIKELKLFIVSSKNKLTKFLTEEANKDIADEIAELRGEEHSNGWTGINQIKSKPTYKPWFTKAFRMEENAKDVLAFEDNNTFTLSAMNQLRQIRLILSWA